ncbi:MAG: RICIN domain-containing protein [Actinomycetota bacterium]|nr:RICIN domain-containing protein [Actinomycetota bacterium]
MAASLGTAALVTAGVAVVSPSAAHAAAGASVSVWETTADRSSLLAAQPAATFNVGSGTASQTITVNPSTTYQSMTGFGASFTDSSSWLVANSPLRNSIMTKLFDPSQGIGLDFLRQPIGASDFARSVYSYDDMPAGQSDPSLANFSISHDNAYILPILQQARQLNPATTIMATPWSPPGWMKTSGSMIGGSLNTADYQVFANYLVKFLQAYRSAGVPVSLITPQNEPEYSPSNYPGSTMTAPQEAAFIGDNLGPAIQSAGLSTKIIGYDHNWNDTAFPETILGDPAAGPYTAGVAWHCYAGDPSAQTTVHNAFPAKDTYFTECSGAQSANPANTFSDSLDWQTENLIIGATRNWAKSVVTWNMALDPSGGPSMNCTTCTGVVTVNNTAGTATYNAEYYVLGQASKFVKPGAVRIGSNTFGSGNIEDVAFGNPDGSDALIVLNADGSNARTFNVEENGQYFTYSLPAKAVATFTWNPGAGGGPDTTPPSAPAGLAASGTTATSTTLSWNASTDNVGVAGYDVYRNGSQIATTGATSYTDTGLSPATTYSYTVKAYDAAGNVSAASNTATVTTGSSGGGGGIISSAWYQVINSNSGKCADAANGGTSNGTAVQQWTCGSGNTNQEWQFQPTSGGYYEVVTRNAPALGWDVTGGPGATGNGVPIQLWTYGGGTNQQWLPVQHANGTYSFTPRNNTSECLDVTNVSTADGARLQQWSCTGAANQSFTLNAVS